MMKRKIVKLSEVAIRTTVKCEPEISDSVRWVGADHLDEGDFTVKRWSTTDDPLFPPTFKFAVKSGSVLIHSRNPKKIATLNFDAITGEKFFCLLPKTPALLHPSFLAYQLQSGHFFEYVMNRFTGSVNKFLNWSALADYEFELPSIEEQHRIVEMMTAVDEHIESLRNQLDVLTSTRKSVLHHLLNAGGEGWTETTLGQVADFRRDRVDPLTLEPAHLLCHWSIPALDEFGGPLWEPAGKIGSHKFQIKKNAVIFALLNPRIPRFSLVNGGDDVVCSTEFAVMQPTEVIHENFLLLFASSNDFHEVVGSLATGTTKSRERAKLRDLAHVVIFLPTLADQKRIVDEASKIDALIQETNSALAATQQLRSALLNKEIS